MVIAVVGILAATSLHIYRPLVSRVWLLSGSIFGFEKFKREAAYQWAISGEWLSDEQVFERFNKDYSFKQTTENVKNVDLKDGAIHIYFGDKLNGRVLTFQPGILKENLSGPVIWVCKKDKDISSEWFYSGNSRTTIHEDIIPREFKPQR